MVALLAVSLAVWVLAIQEGCTVCIVPDEPFKEIRNSSEEVQKLIKLITTGAQKGKAYDELAHFVDKFGSRMVGSVQLEKSIDNLVEKLKLERFHDVHTEDVVAVQWQRLHESARMIKPEKYNLKILGLGGSVGTPPGGITATVAIVRSFTELEMKGQSVSGRIVLYLPEWKGHANYASYLMQGTTKAAKLGALACLFRAPEPLTGTALYAGLTKYEKNTERIAAAVLIKQDADLLARMVDRRDEVQIHLQLDPRDPQQVVTRNIVTEWRGTKYPKEYILLGAHIDSWDIGQGAADNAASIFVILRALSILNKGGLRPKRTVRFVVWTAREQGMEGALEFYRRYASDSGRTTLAVELDLGGFTPTGLALSDVKNNDTVCIVREMLKEFEIINANSLSKGGYAEELKYWRLAGVPVAGLMTTWYYHEDMRHTEADTVSGLRSSDLDLNTAIVAGLVHMLGQMEHKLPR